jgi:hypothetical protein
MTMKTPLWILELKERLPGSRILILAIWNGSNSIVFDS